MKKKLYLVACLTLAINSLVAFDARKFFNHKDRESQYMFLEKIFITDIHADKKYIWTHLEAIVPAACAIIAGYQYFTTMPLNDSNLFQNLDKDEIKRLLDIHTLQAEHHEKNATIDSGMYIAAATISAAIVSIQALKCYIHNYVNRQAVTIFMQNWNNNRPYTPSEYHNIFDALASIMDMHGDQAVLQHANEIVDMMQFIVMRHFTSRYESALKIEAIDTMTTTKSILDCIKASFDVKSSLIA